MKTGIVRFGYYVKTPFDTGATPLDDPFIVNPQIRQTVIENVVLQSPLAHIKREVKSAFPTGDLFAWELLQVRTGATRAQEVIEAKRFSVLVGSE